jgi:iron complex transport system ATP-binding protein
VASGAADEVLTSDLVSDTLDYPLAISRVEGRWAVRTRR